MTAQNLSSRLTAASLFLLFGFLLAGCRSDPLPEESLEDRILERWGSMIERDFESVWGFHTPGFRQVTPVDAFVRDMSLRPVRWEEVELLRLECDESLCSARLRVVYQLPVGPPGLRGTRVPTFLDEQWVKIDRRWWFVAG